MEAVLSGHEQSSIPNPFLSNHYLKEQMGLAVLLLHERRIRLATESNTHRKWYPHRRPWWDLRMDRTGCDCWTSLFWTGGLLLPCQEKKERYQWKHLRLFPGEGENIHVQFACSIAAAGVKQSDTFVAVGKQKMCIPAQGRRPSTVNTAWLLSSNSLAEIK